MIAQSVADATRSPSPGRGGIGGLRPPFLVAKNAEAQQGERGGVSYKISFCSIKTKLHACG
jgi:hypothetical protein